MTHRVFRTILVGLVIALVSSACESGLETPTIQAPDPDRTLAEGTVHIRHVHNVGGRSWNYIELEVGPVSGASSYEAQVMFDSKNDRHDVAWTEDWLADLSGGPGADHLRRDSSRVVTGNAKTVPGITHFRIITTGTISLRVRALVNGSWTAWKTDSEKLL